MPDRLSIVRRNLHRVQQRIVEAAAKAGRDPAEVTLVGVTKYVDAATARLLVKAGCQDLGESRPQELWAKTEMLSDLPVRWHQIGHLQRNKVDRTIKTASLIHTVDSGRLLAAINSSAARQSMVAEVLLEVNISGDESKHGFAPDDMPDAVANLGDLASVRARGLMAMAAREGDAEVARRNFARLRELRDELQSSLSDRGSLAELSMGMSGDFQEAITEGATIVRVGSALWEGLD